MSRVCALTLAALVAAGFAVLDGRAAEASAPGTPRILYSSDWSGRYQVYALDPEGRLPTRQLTSGRAPACQGERPCGYVAPEPSPDGSKVLFWDHVEGGSWYVHLFVARADGSGRRQLATVNHFRPAPASWSPDARRIAYADRDGVRVVGAGGGRSSLVAPARDLLFGDVSWSPDGRWIAYEADGLRLVSPDGRRARKVAGAAGDFTWSPDGRLLAFTADGIRGYDVRTGVVRRLSNEVGSKLAWSADGKLIAMVTRRGLGLVVVKTGVYRPLNQDVLAEGSTLSWSPDSRFVTYVRHGARPLGLDTTELRLVDRRGYVRTVVGGAGRYAGSISGHAWTRPPAGVRYAAAQERTLATSSRQEVVAPFPIERLAADGRRVAYASCGHVFAWTPSTGRVEQAEDSSSLSPRCFESRGIVSLAIADDRVATAWVGGGNTTFWWLGGAMLQPARTGFELGSGSGTTGSPKTNRLDHLVGSGSLLVFSARDESSRNGTCCQVVTTRERIVSAAPNGCPCAVIASEPGPFVPNDVDESRIAAVGDNAVVLLDFDGRRLLAVDVKARAAQLSGRELVVQAGERLLDVDAVNGAELHAWPLAGSASLQDAARGVAAYALDGQVHLLRLADGRDEVIAAGTTARFMDDGLVVANGLRLRLVPFAALPLER